VILSAPGFSVLCFQGMERRGLLKAALLLCLLAVCSGRGKQLAPTMLRCNCACLYLEVLIPLHLVQFGMRMGAFVKKKERETICKQMR
jgi:hypothetical protein